tara:strand:+ start:222 stop:1196 length:975 start_codon:yes stop_codon:yes gene_type:complete
MNPVYFSSLLSDRFLQFVRLRQQSGTDYASSTRLLMRFDTFLVEQKLSSPSLSRDLYLQYINTLDHLAPLSRDNHLCVVRQLCRYLALFEPSCYIPEGEGINKASRQREPYIFSSGDISQLLRLAKELPGPPTWRASTYATLFGLLYSTGIRIGEARSLTVGDVYLREQRIHIRQGKYHKARWIPLSKSCTEQLNHHLNQSFKNKCLPVADTPLFLSRINRSLSYPIIRRTFRSLCQEADIQDRNQGLPRLHDLRHTFAVHCLLRWYQQNIDVQAYLPALATYMGHVGIASTQVYLHATTELMAKVSENFHAYFKHSILDGGVA